MHTNSTHDTRMNSTNDIQMTVTSCHEQCHAYKQYPPVQSTGLPASI
jgi:hypothetical protein